MPDPKFIADFNVGRLAKWLRIAGYDTLFVTDMEDGELVRRAQRENRVILTRDSSIMRRRVVTSGHLKALLISSDDPRSQLRQVMEEYVLDDGRGLSRCIECNVPLADVGKEGVRERVPPFVFQTQEEFMECPCCHKLYWRGTHWKNMRQELTRMRGGPE